MRTGALLVLAVLAVSAVPPVRAGDRPFEPENLWATERRLVAELSLLRRERGLPSLMWCERMAMPMRLHLDAFLEAGYRGEGAPPARVGRCSKRAPENHRWPWGEIFANFGTARRSEYDPREQIDRMLSNPVIRSYTDAAQNAGACVLRPIEGGKIVVYLAVAKVEEKAVQDELDKVATLAAWAFGGSAKERETALSRIGPEAVHEGVPLYLGLWKDRDPSRRLAAARALGAVADPFLVPILIEGFGDKDAGVREATLASLRAVTGKREFGPDGARWTKWWEASKDEFKPAGKWEPSEEAEPDEPGEQGGEEAPPVVPAPPPKDPLELTGGAATQWVKKALSAKAPVVKMFCARAVGRTGNATAASRLFPLLEGPPFPVREEAARALARCSNKSLFSKIAGAIPRARNAPHILLHLYKALGRAGDRRGVKILLAGGFGDPNPAVASACARALGSIRKKAAVSALIRILGEAESRGNKVPASVARSSLAALTRASPGKSAADWASWWAKNRSKFSFPD